MIHKANGGLSNARNAGLRIATGDWIAFLDSDDYMEPTMLQSLHDAAISQEADMTLCSALFFNEQETWTPDWFHLDPGVINGLDILKTGHIPTALVVAWNKLYRREIFTSIEFPIGRIHEDEAIAHEILGKCGKIVCLDSKLYHYRQNPEGITKKAFSAMRLDMILAMADRVMYYQKSGLGKWAAPVLNDFWWHIVDKYFRIAQTRETREKRKECLKAARLLRSHFVRAKGISLSDKFSYCLFCLSPKVYASTKSRNVHIIRSVIKKHR